MLIAAGAQAAPIYLTFKSSYKTNEQIPLFNPEVGNFARVTGKVFLPDDKLLTNGKAEYYWSAYEAEWEGTTAPRYPNGYLDVVMRNYDWDYNIYLPGFYQYGIEFPWATSAFGYSFTKGSDGQIRGEVSHGGWRDDSFSFRHGIEQMYGWPTDVHVFDGDLIYQAEFAPGKWVSAQVPEPGTLLLLTGALAGLAFSRRRKQS
jgi:hypothetical protein